jgi:hypothetical protein
MCRKQCSNEFTTRIVANKQIYLVQNDSKSVWPNVAVSRVPAKKVAGQLFVKLPKKTIMHKMHHEAGIRLAVQTVFVENCFVVMQLQVQHVDYLRLLSTSSTRNIDDDSVTAAAVDKWIEEQGRLAMPREDP